MCQCRDTSRVHEPPGKISDEGGRGLRMCATAFSSLNPGIGGIGCDIAAAGAHKVKPCSEGSYS